MYLETVVYLKPSWGNVKEMTKKHQTYLQPLLLLFIKIIKKLYDDEMGGHAFQKSYAFFFFLLTNFLEQVF